MCSFILLLHCSWLIWFKCSWETNASTNTLNDWGDKPAGLGPTDPRDSPILPSCTYLLLTDQTDKCALYSWLIIWTTAPPLIPPCLFLSSFNLVVASFKSSSLHCFKINLLALNWLSWCGVRLVLLMVVLTMAPGARFPLLWYLSGLFVLLSDREETVCCQLWWEQWRCVLGCW